MNKFKHVVGRKRRMALGGTASYGNEITGDDVRGREVGSAGIVGTSVASGALTGAGAGAAIGSIVPGVGTLLGGAIGGLVGVFSGLFGGRRKAKKAAEEEAARREAERKQTLVTMQQKLDVDAQRLRQYDYTDNGMQGYYAKYGGRIGRRRMAGGGIVPNSSDTMVAYGATHNQYNPEVGGYGVPYADVEVEGGGYSNGQPQAGEVIKETGDQALVFSDKLKIPGMNRTFADAAKKISDRKGNLENKAQGYATTINAALDDITKPMTTASKNTSLRNLEKTAFDFDRTSAKIAEFEELENELFDTQEMVAESKGLREGNTIQMKFGGRMGRKRKDFGGALSLGNFALNTVNALQTRGAINREANAKLPKRNTNLTAPEYSSYFGINNQLSEINSSVGQAKEYINNNTNNSQVARANIASLSVRAAEARGNLYSQKNAYENEVYNRNRDAAFQIQQYNNEAAYSNALDEYNKYVGINEKRNANTSQFLQSTATLFSDIADRKLQEYISGATYLGSASDADAGRLKDLYNDVYGIDYSGISNRFKSLFGRQNKAS